MDKKKQDKEASKKFNINDHLPAACMDSDTMLNLYKWTFDDAAAAQTKFENENPGTVAKGPLFQWQGAQELIELYESYHAGDKGAVLKALHICFFTHLPIPRWCENAYLGAYRSVKFYNAKTWGDVFGSPHKKGAHLSTKKQETNYSFRVYDRIKQIKEEDPSIPIDGFLFESVGKEFGIGGKTLTEEYYYKWKNYFDK
jgi:hypothetical protein